MRQRIRIHASVFVAALEATPVSMCVIAENWNDHTGGVTSDRHPEVLCLQGIRMPVEFVPSSPVKQYVPRISSWLHLGCHCGGQCCHESGSSRILPDVLCDPGGVISVGADFGCSPELHAVSLARMVVMVGMVAGLRESSSSTSCTCSASWRRPHPWRVLMKRWPTSSAFQLDWRVARDGVRLCLCGQWLRSRSGSEVDSRRLHGETPGLVFGP